MKKVLGAVLAAVIAASASAVLAGDGCCAAKAAAAKSGGACDMAGKLSLTDAQKTKLATLQDRVKHATSTSEGRTMMEKGLAEILTPEQLAQCKANCDKDKDAAGKCPFATGKTDKKS